MNKLTIIGNLTRDPDIRVTSQGISVCEFTVAVNKRKIMDESNPADFFKVTAWRQLGENCGKFLAKGRKVCVVGPVSVRTYQTNSGETRASLEVVADDVEFLSGRNENRQDAPAPAGTPEGFTAVDPDGLPFE